MKTAILMIVSLAAPAALAAEKRFYKLPRPREPNVVDEARFSLAEAFAANEEFHEAVSTLEQVAAKSPDGNARSAAHLGLARIWSSELGDGRKAEEELSKVEGRLAAKAVDELILPEMRRKDLPAAAEKLLGFLARTKDPFARVAAARKLIGLVRAKGLEGRTFLMRLCDLLSYEDAGTLAKAERELRSERAKYAEKMKQARLLKKGLGPKAKKAEKQKGLLKKIKRLVAEGRLEEARKLKEKLAARAEDEGRREFDRPPAPRALAPEDEF